VSVFVNNDSVLDCFVGLSMALACIKDVPRPPCGCVREGGGLDCQRSRGCASDGAWISYYNALASALGAESGSGSKVWGCCCGLSFGDVETGFDGSGERGCCGMRSRLVNGFRDGSEEVGEAARGVTQRLIGEVGGSVLGQSDGYSGVNGVVGDRSGSVGQGIEEGAVNGLGSVDSAGFLGADRKTTVAGLTKTEMNRLARRKAKERKARKKERQFSAALSSKDWNADKLISKRPGFFSECPVEVQEELRQTRAELLIARNRHDKAMIEKKLKI